MMLNFPNSKVDILVKMEEGQFYLQVGYNKNMTQILFLLTKCQKRMIKIYQEEEMVREVY
jgi:hypothetical protein